MGYGENGNHDSIPAMHTRIGTVAITSIVGALCLGCTYQGLPGQFRPFSLEHAVYVPEKDRLGGSLTPGGWFMPWNASVSNVRTDPPSTFEIKKRPTWMKDQAELYFAIEQFSRLHEPIRVTCDIRQDWVTKQKLVMIITPLPEPAIRIEGNPYELRASAPESGSDRDFKIVKVPQAEGTK